MSRYLVGIDLGTTHSSVAYVDTLSKSLSIQTLNIPQWGAPGRLESLPQLPSFLYFPDEGELPTGSLQLPWQSEESFQVVGQLARDLGALRPDQLVQSAKSWLSSPAAARKEAILPVGAPRLSPLEVSSRYLRHILEGWEWAVAKGDLDLSLADQQVVLTIPASFDEVARRLTLEAARLAGLNRVTLLEEPQAAFYSWLMDHEKEALPVGSVVVVCDVGGGTTDFSAIEVTESGFSRTAVGEHLLLGGDNMDIALAHLVEPRFGGELEPSEWLSLCQQARRAKEERLDEFTFVLEGKGSQLVGGSRKATLGRGELESLLMEGFFKPQGWEEALAVRRKSVIRSGGLSYESEPSIIKQLARFLKRSGVRPSHLLFNGGAMWPEPFQRAVQESLSDWVGDVSILPRARLDLAVARGAAYFSRLGLGVGKRIGGGIARGYYLDIQVGEERKALTLLPRGSEGGARYESEESFQLIANQPVFFRLYTSQTRLSDKPGDLIDLDEEQLMALPAITTLLRFGKGKSRQVAARLHVELTEVGTLEIWLSAVESSHRWKLEFQVRGSDTSAVGTARVEEGFALDQVAAAGELLVEMWRAGKKQLLAPLEKLLDKPRLEWPPNLLRELWERLFALADERKTTLDREARWWNLMGFLLRPGAGAPLDEFRVRLLWRLILREGVQPLREEVEVQRVICYRRIAAGLTAGQQQQLVSSLQNGRGGAFLLAERQRTLAAFELLPQRLKADLGRGWLERVCSGAASEVDCFALARVGARRLLYGSIGHVVPRALCVEWVEELLARAPFDAKVQRMVARIAARTPIREHDLPRALLEQLRERIEDPNEKRQLLEVVERSVEERDALLGDRLPTGLILD